MKKQKTSIGIVCPVYNEEENILHFFEAFDEINKRLKESIKLEFLLLDNASDDSSENMLSAIATSRSDVYYVRFSRNFGVMKSIYTGLLVSPPHWDGLTVYDCDLQDPPELIEEFIVHWLDGHDIVYGKRINRDETIVQSVFRKLFKFAERAFHSVPRQIESGAWFASSKVVKQIKTQRYFQQYLPAVIDELGFKKKAVEYARKKRIYGTTKFNFFSYFSYAFDGLIVGSFFALRIPIFIGFFLAMLSMILGVYFILLKFTSDIEFPEGTVAIIIITLFANAMNFIFLGIIGEYTGRILNHENYKRPAIIDYTINDDQLDAI